MAACCCDGPLAALRGRRQEASGPAPAPPEAPPAAAVAPEAAFQDAAARARGLSERTTQGDLLKVYALFKQASMGDAKGPQPSAWSVKARAKYDAWAKLKGMSADEARGQYVRLIDDL